MVSMALKRKDIKNGLFELQISLFFSSFDKKTFYTPKKEGKMWKNNTYNYI
jgi:hypothetical protein